MTPEEVRETIEQSRPDEWEYFEPEPTWVLKTDRDVSIRLVRQYDHDDRKVEKPDWANVANSTTAEDILRIEFRGTPVDEEKVIELDGYRLTMVYPQRDVDEPSGDEQLFITDYEAQLSRIMSLDDFDQKTGQLEVEIR